jgi:hypothetical protein
MVSERAPFGQLDRPDEVMLATPDSYGVGREVLPRPVEELLFDPGHAGAVVLLLFVVVGATVAEWRRRGPDPRWRMPLFVLALQAPTLLLVWHASTAELGRLSLPSALVLRVLLCVQLALLADRWLSPAASATTPPSSPPV